jgi:hypothetical protein
VVGKGELCRVSSFHPFTRSFSENSELDGKEIDLQTALKETIGYQMGTFISCIPGKLAYFEDEDGRYILER